MISLDSVMTRSTRAAKRTLATHWVGLCERFGTPSEHSALGSLHYLLTEYREPDPSAPVLPYKMELGPYQIGQETDRLSVGSRRLSVVVTRPLEAVPERLFLLSPGLGAHGSANRYLEQHLASHGYLVVRPVHRGSDLLATVLKTPLGAFTKGELQRRLEELQTALQAAGEGRWQRSYSDLEIALGGHSFGALTCCVLAGLPVKEGLQLPRRQFGALVALSPYGDSFPSRRLGIEVQGFDALTVPMLFMSGSKDELFTLGKGHRTHLEPFQLARQAANRRHVIVGGTRHGNFSEVFGWMKKETKVMVNSTVTAFLDSHLQERQAAREYLDEQLALAAFEYGSWAF